MFKKFGIATAAALILGACGQATEAPSSENRDTVTVSHQLGETTVYVNPQNVVVLDFGPLDALHYLGVDLLGVPQASNLPEHLDLFNGDQFQNAGSLAEPDFEAIFAMNPELIIISGRLAEAFDDLSAIAPTIHMATGADYMPSFTANMAQLGAIFGLETEVEEALARIESRVEEVQDVVGEGREALVLLVNDGQIMAFGEHSRFGVIHNTFGFEPAAYIAAGGGGTAGSQEINFEFILETDPAYIFVIDRSAVLGHAEAHHLLDNELVNATRAGESGNIHFLTFNVWHTAPGGFGSTHVMIDDILGAME